MPLNASLDHGTVVTEAPVLSCGLVFEDDAPDGDARAGQGCEEEGLRVQGFSEAGVLAEKVRESQGTGQTSGNGESLERVDQEIIVQVRRESVGRSLARMASFKVVLAGIVLD